MSEFIAWIACDCTVWPIDRLVGYGRCGYCGVRPHTQFDPPSDGQTHILSWYAEGNE